MNDLYLLIIVGALMSLVVTENVPCDLRKTEFGYVCVCTSERCDYLDNPEPILPEDLIIISSTKVGLRFHATKIKFTEPGFIHSIKSFAIDRPEPVPKSLNGSSQDNTDFDPVSLLIDEEGKVSINLGNKSRNQSWEKVSINRHIKYQKVVGFGGGFTGSVSHLLQKLNQPLQDHIYRSFFARDGIAFNLIRIAIGSSDFDLEPWAYNEFPIDDTTLNNFTQLDARDKVKIDQLKRLKKVAQLETIKIKAAAWSPPLWMKTKYVWNGQSSLKPEYYQTWADYHLRFIELMHSENMPIWAISTGNEPLNGNVAALFTGFVSLGWTPQKQALWLSEHLGPTIKNSQHKNVLIFGNDDQRFTYPAWFRMMNSTRSDALDYLDGLAVHWYYDNLFSPILLDSTHEMMPEKLLLNTESCLGALPWEKRGPKLGSWERAEIYLHALIQDFQHSVNGWIDWNIGLDEIGGPNYAKNYVDAPLIMNMTNRMEIYKQPIFYALGHFGKFIPEGSTRIFAETSQRIISNIKVVAFKRPDERVVSVIFNSGHTSVYLELNDSIRGSTTIGLPAHSVHTFIYN